MERYTHFRSSKTFDTHLYKGWQKGEKKRGQHCMEIEVIDVYLYTHKEEVIQLTIMEHTLYQIQKYLECFPIECI